MFSKVPFVSALLVIAQQHFFADAFVVAPLTTARRVLPPVREVLFSSLPRFTEECSLDDDEIFSCLASQGYQETPIEIQKVYASQIESLRDRFDSFENEGDVGSNMIKFSKRLRGQEGRHPVIHHRSANDTTTTSGIISANGSSQGTLKDDDGGSSSRSKKEVNSHIANMQYNHMVSNDEYVLVDTLRTRNQQPVSRAFLRAGPRKHLHFDPSNVNAAIVTCGGLCPGLNNVIRELTHSLYYLYGANKVYGVRGGFHGFSNSSKYEQPVLLSNEMVENIHHEGGTALSSSRGGFDVDEILSFLRKKRIGQLYIIGGDGTHRAAYKIHQACISQNLNVAVAGIPKTIDNDLDYIDRSFGFLSAVEAAQASIRTAKTEAMCSAPTGVGIIKLMGRSAGFLAAFAALGSGDVDAVLLPEVPIVLEGSNGILPFLRQRVKEQQYAVVVVAEGAGEELLGASTEVDKGGNRKLPPIGEFIKDKVNDYFLAHGEEAGVRYIDPSYMVRSIPANAADSLYCLQLAQNAVHGAMAGFTGFSVGMVNNNAVYLPIPQLVATSPRSMDPQGQTWEQILAMTGQPNTAEPPAKKGIAEEGAEEVDFPKIPVPMLR